MVAQAALALGNAWVYKVGGSLPIYMPSHAVDNGPTVIQVVLLWRLSLRRARERE